MAPVNIEDFSPLYGDRYDAICRWDGHADIGVEAGQPMAFSVRVKRLLDG